MSDNTFTNMEIIEVFKLTTTHGYMCIEFEFEGKNTKIKNAQLFGFIETMQLTLKIDSNLCNRNV